MRARRLNPPHHRLRTESFHRSVRIERPAAEVFAWHERPGAFVRLQPPWETVEVVSQKGGIRDGARVVLRAKAGPVWTLWEVEHRDYVAGKRFRDVQIKGPFAKWEHLHRIEPSGANACVLHDEITYALPFGGLGRAGAGFVRSKLDRMFRYRHAITKADLETATHLPPGPALRVLISGLSGLVGTALESFLTTQGHSVLRLVRGSPKQANEIAWDPTKGELDFSSAGSIDAVVHLAGAGIADARWTEARKAVIRNSRTDSTRTLVKAITALKVHPRVLVSASAVGFYGDTEGKVVDEVSGPGRGFLAEVCGEWETEACPAVCAGIRTVWLRTGVVLSPAGGALARMLPPFRAGVGGRLGAGTQGMSWIALDDLLDVIYRALRDERCAGPLNAVVPEPCSNAEFTSVLAGVLRRPAILPVPAFALKLIFGQMAEETLLADSRVKPSRLQSLGHTYRLPRLEDALAHVLGRDSSPPKP